MTYGYIRVSSDHQTVENQRFEINRFCRENQMAIDGWIDETISGTKNYNSRQLGQLLANVQKDDIIICSELSRLGRNLFMIMEILNLCMAKECRVWTIKDGYRLGDDIQSKVLAFAFGLSAEIERNLISQRTKEALLRRKEEGMKLGRPAGKRSKMMRCKLFGTEAKIIYLRRHGLSFRQISEVLEVGRDTVRRFYRRFLGETLDHASMPRARDFLTTVRGSEYAARINERRLARLAREEEKRMRLLQEQNGEAGTEESTEQQQAQAAEQPQEQAGSRTQG